ncbi:MAG: membrane protein insertion efficiency factor YidD [Candidatus Parcubacteria bacterium]|nr:membrane protein insertion efficiency factor YidD [Candidatus Parcubacteria bacterium]
MKKFLKYIQQQFKFVVLHVIILYQKTLSFDHGPLAKIFPFWGCKYYPTCSEYTYQAINKYGVVKGSWLGLKRLIRCHPFAKGGNDPVP